MFIYVISSRPFKPPFPTPHWAVSAVHMLLAVIFPFTSSMASNPLLTPQTLFGLSLDQRRFYTFMGSSALPWERRWSVLYSLIPAPVTDQHLVVALVINPKVGRKIFGCGVVFDYVAKANQSTYHWAQNVVMVGLLKGIKARWPTDSI